VTNLAFAWATLLIVEERKKYDDENWHIMQDVIEQVEGEFRHMIS
jgi:hypothetical protein